MKPLVKVNQYVSVFDTRRFGIKVAKLDRVDEETPAVVAALADEGTKLVIARISAADVAGINRLEAIGFRLKDFQVLQRFDLREPFKRRPSAVVVRDLDRGQVEDVVKVAAASFAGYGHYAADDRLNREQCRDGYTDWVRRSCEDRTVADKVIVADLDGTVVGFLTLKLFESGGQKFAAGGIGAVAPAYRGHGVFSSIVVHGLEWGKNVGLDWEEHGALITNYSVNRVFSHIGFKIVDASVTLHAWL
jgi:GNAT superfamily N-acetyltransferase